MSSSATDMVHNNERTPTELDVLSTKYLKDEMSDKITEVDLFLENCSSLYNLILDALHDLSSKSTALAHLSTSQRRSKSPLAPANRGDCPSNPDGACCDSSSPSTKNSLSRCCATGIPGDPASTDHVVLFRESHLFDAFFAAHICCALSIKCADEVSLRFGVFASVALIASRSRRSRSRRWMDSSCTTSTQCVDDEKCPLCLVEQEKELAITSKSSLFNLQLTG
ncbi:hypothetical protein Aduo_016950 [Ancylostoma duodenale]